jgi:uncharacterized membrane protein YgcG
MAPPLALALALALLLLCLLSPSCHAHEDGRTMASIPNPMLDPSACGREGVPKSAICDVDRILSKDDKDEIEGYINKITTAQLAVAVINKMSLSGLSTTDKSVASEKFARGLHDKWGVGSAEKNDGILIFLSISDRLVYISTGAGVQKTLNYNAIQAVIQHMRGFLREQQYGRSIINAVIQIDLLLSGKGSQILDSYASDNHMSISEFLLMVGLLILFGGTCGYLNQRSKRQMQRCQQGKDVLNKLMKAVDQDGKVKGESTRNTYLSSSCPICLEEFPKVEKNKKDSGETDAKSPMAIQCGHVFCKGCLEEYLLTDGCKCPICRAPVDNIPPPKDTLSRRAWRSMFSTRIQSPPDNTGYSTSANTVGSRTYGSTTQTMTMDPYYSSAFEQNTPEFRFRVYRMRSLYPDIMTGEMLRSMDRALDRGSHYDFRSELDAQAMQLQRTIDDIRRASEVASRDYGSDGSSGSFDGGCSSGGGGGDW